MEHSKNKSQRLGVEPIIPLLIKLSVPSIAAMAIQASYSVVDSIFVGRLGTEQLSALSLAFPIQMVLIGIAVGTGVGANSLISRMLGSGRKQEAEITAGNTLLISLLYGITGLVIGLFFSEQLFRLFADDEVLISMGTEYIRIILLGSIFMFVPSMSSNILRGQGNTFIPMVTMLVGSILNVILDPFFIYGISIFPEWGIRGAAFATVLSRAISSVYILMMLFNKKNELRLSSKTFKPGFKIIKGIYTVGFPAMIMQFLGSFMLAGINKILSTFSTTAIAVAGIYFRMQSFIFMPIFGLNHGYLPIMGYNYGLGDKSRMREAFFSTLATALVFSGIGLVMFQTIPGFLVRMFNDNPELVQLGTGALKTISLSFPLAAACFVGSASFQAIGKGFPGLLFSVIRSVAVLLLMPLLGSYYGLDCMWYAFLITELVTALLAGIWLTITLRKIM